jgi:hypothetical protein
MTVSRDGSRGLGDRWLAGESLPGVAFALNDGVEVLSGRHEGRRGTIALLMAVAPEPVYLVALGAGAGQARVRQADLRPSE